MRARRAGTVSGTPDFVGVGVSVGAGVGARACPADHWLSGRMVRESGRGGLGCALSTGGEVGKQPGSDPQDNQLHEARDTPSQGKETTASDESTGGQEPHSS